MKHQYTSRARVERESRRSRGGVAQESRSTRIKISAKNKSQNQCYNVIKSNTTKSNPCTRASVMLPQTYTSNTKLAETSLEGSQGSRGGVAEESRSRANTKTSITSARTQTHNTTNIRDADQTQTTSSSTCHAIMRTNCPPGHDMFHYHGGLVPLVRQR